MSMPLITVGRYLYWCARWRASDRKVNQKWIESAQRQLRSLQDATKCRRDVAKFCALNKSTDFNDVWDDICSESAATQ